MPETPTIILHQYALSPFSEKVRRVLAAKRVRHATVEQPMWAPKPKLTPLTGGYRRIPVMQIGADVFCDTACIVRELERLHPEPSVFPDGTYGVAHAIAWWADRQLFPAVATMVLAAVGATLPPEFREDRERIVPGLRFDLLPAARPFARDQVRAFCHALDVQLTGRPFLLGARFSVADAACFHSLWFARMDPATATLLQPFIALAAWFARVEGLGTGEGVVLEPDAALGVARDATPAPREHADPADPRALAPGARVTVTPDDYGCDPVAGALVALDAEDCAIRRHDPEVGEVVVHFPRAGFRLAPA